MGRFSYVDRDSIRNHSERIFVRDVVSEIERKRLRWQNRVENPGDRVAFVPIDPRTNLDHHLAVTADERSRFRDDIAHSLPDPFMQVRVHAPVMHAGA